MQSVRRGWGVCMPRLNRLFKGVLQEHSSLWIVLPCAVLLCALQLTGDDVIKALRFERAAVLHGEWYRLFTGHWVHLSLNHLWLNLVGLAAIALLFFRRVSLGLLSAFWLFLMVWISLGLVLAGIDWYVGFSGVLYGWLVWGILCTQRLSGRYKAVLLMGCGLKVAFDAASGSAVAEEAFVGGKVIWQSHGLGMLGAFIFFGACCAWQEHLAQAGARLR